MSRKRPGKRPLRKSPGKAAKPGGKPAADVPARLAPAEFGRRFILRSAAWLPVAALVWLFILGPYNRFLIGTTELVMNVFESPDVTRLISHEKHHVLITRMDFPTSKGHLASLRVTDVHFPLIMMLAFFLATPGVSWSRRLETLGIAFVVSMAVHVFTMASQVQFVYVHELGDWSQEHYGELSRNFWAITQHLFKIPFKFALPLVLWAAFYVRLLLPERSAGV